MSSPTTRPIRTGILRDLGRLAYREAWSLQRALVARRVLEQCPDILLLVEHDPVFTVGRSGKESHWHGDLHRLRLEGHEVYEVERGGSMTFHGPGQLVGYPILTLRNFCRGPKAYVRLLEEVLIQTLEPWGIRGIRVEKQPGVWVEQKDGALAKIAAIGVRIAQGVTMHGFALNVSVDVTPFSRIVPCGIEGCRVTSLAQATGRPPELPRVRQRLVAVFGDLFGLEWEGDESDLGHEGPLLHET